MARRKKTPKPQTVRQIRKKVEEDLKMGGRKLPEDEVKKPKRAKKITPTSTRKRINAEEQRARKGRAPAKEKEKTPSNGRLGRPRKSDIEKEYTHELQKIRNRLKYREKQGFFVKWETLPVRPSRISESDIEKLKQYQVQMNELGEITVVRTEFNEYAREMPQKLRLKYTDLPNYTIENDPNFVPPMETVQHFEIFDEIEARLIYSYSLVQNEGTRIDHPINEDRWVELSAGVEEAYGEAIQTFRKWKDSPRRQEYADYLYNHQYEVLEAIDVLLEVSDDDQLQSARTELLEYLNLH